MAKNVTFQNPIHHEENTPLVTVTETNIAKRQSVGFDARGARYVLDLSKASFGAAYYPIPGSQWYAKKISGVWTVMARASRQNPQLSPSITPHPGDTFIGGEGTTYVANNLQVNGNEQVNGNSQVNGDSQVNGNSNIAGNLQVGGVITPGTDAEIGTIKIHASNTPPTGWLICDGTAVSRTTYAQLFTVVGVNFGVGDGSTTFNLPDLRGKVPVGRDSGQTEFDVLGETGGEKTHTLTAQELPDHNHGLPMAIGASANNTTDVAARGTGPGDTNFRNRDLSVYNSVTYGSAAITGSRAHNNLQPYISLNYIIKALSNYIPPTALTGITADGFHAVGSSSASEGHTARVTGDIAKRYIVRDDGKTEWGDGTNIQDTNLYRSAANVLKTDDSLIVDGSGLTVTNDFTYGGQSVGRGVIDTYYSVATSIANSSGTEVAIPSANYTAEPTLSLANGRVFRFMIQFGAYPASATLSQTVIRVRKGTATISGTQLGYYNAPLGAYGALVAAYSYVGFFKNTSGSTVSTKLSITNQRSNGAASTWLYGDSNIPILMTVEDIGSTSASQLSNLVANILSV